MRDYEKIIDDLRNSDEYSADHRLIGVCLRAAAAIEELEKERDYYKQQYENRQRLIKCALGEEWT